MHNKKALIASNALQFIPRLFFLIVVCLCIVALSRSYLNLTFDTFEQETNLFYQSLLFSPPLAHQDILTDRTYPGIMSIENLNSDKFPEMMSESIKYDYPIIAAKIQLKFDAQETASYYNPAEQKGYNEWEILAKSRIQGPGSARTKNFVLPNTLYITRDNQLRRAILNITVLMRNS